MTDVGDREGRAGGIEFKPKRPKFFSFLSFLPLQPPATRTVFGFYLSSLYS